MSTAADDLLELFRRFLPMRTGPCALTFVAGYETPVWRDDQGHLRVALSLATFDPPDAPAPRDVREQEVYLGDGALAQERWRAYVEGHLRALPAIVAHHGIAVELLLPSDLFAYQAVLADAALQQADDFAAALSDPERLAALDQAARDAEWREQLEGCNLAEHADEVRALGRPSLRLHLDRDWSDEDDEDEEDEDEQDGDESTWPTGQTRLGGAPDLPPSLPWPEVDGVPLTFVAQFDLAELSRHDAARELPSHGLLSFFYAPCPPDGVRGHPVRVLHLTDTDVLARRLAPAGVESLASYEIRVAEELLFPAIASYFCYEALLPEAHVLACHRARKAGTGKEPVPMNALAHFIAGAEEVDDPERPFHRLLGHPAAIQGDPYLDVEVDTLAQGWDGWEDDTPESLRIRRQALRWRLLLQIDAQERDDLNQDGGFFYFWIPADALARHDWTQARGALQCH